MEKISKKNIQIGIAVIVIAGVCAAFFFGKPAVAPEDGVLETEQSATSTEVVEKVTTPIKRTVVSEAGDDQVSLSYQNALVLYPADKRIQLSGTTSCQATPTNVTYKNGTSIMIDNRSAQSHTIKLGTTYVIPGYGFKIVKLSSATLPYAFFVDCDKQQNIATLSVQK